MIETLGIAGDIGKLPLLRRGIETGFRVRKTNPSEVHHGIDILEVLDQQVELGQINRVSWRRALARLDRIERRHLVGMGEQLSDNVLP